MKKSAAPLCLRREWATQEGLPLLTAVLSLPSPPEGAHPRIRQFYQLQAQSFLQSCQNRLLPCAREALRSAQARSALPDCAEVSLTGQVTLHRGRIWSLWTQLREAGPLPRLCRWGDVWDLETGFPLPLDRFLPGGGRCLVRRTRQALETLGSGDRWATRRFFDPRRFYLTPQGLTWFYPQGTLFPPADGVPLFFLPWETEGLALPDFQTEKPPP